MARNAEPGQLRTRIEIKKPVRSKDADGYGPAEYVNVFSEGKSVFCKWVNAHGKEVFEARQIGLIEPATLTMRYTDRLTSTCIISRKGDANPYEVISINDVENRHTWLEVRVQRKDEAK